MHNESKSNEVVEVPPVVDAPPAPAAVQPEPVKKKEPRREPNAIIGEVVCPHHDRAPVVADVKKNIKGKLYYDCPRCGLVMPARAHFQNWMLEKSTMFDEKERTAARSRGTAVKPAPAAKKPKWSERLL